jgi:hypothetical protein
MNTRGLGHGITHLAGAAIGDEPHGIDALARRTRGDDDLATAQRIVDAAFLRRGEQCVDDRGRLDHATGPGFAAGLCAFSRTEDLDATLAQRGDVRLRRGIRPHQAVHRGHDDDRHVGREAQRREQVVGEAMRKARNEVRGRRRDHDALRPARQLDVSHRRLGRGIPQIGAHRAAGERLKSKRRDELARAGRHDDLHVGAALLEAARELGALVCGDPTRDPEQDAHG